MSLLHDNRSSSSHSDKPPPDAHKYRPITHAISYPTMSSTDAMQSSITSRNWCRIVVKSDWRFGESTCSLRRNRCSSGTLRSLPPSFSLFASSLQSSSSFVVTLMSRLCCDTLFIAELISDDECRWIAAWHSCVVMYSGGSLSFRKSSMSSVPMQPRVLVTVTIIRTFFGIASKSQKSRDDKSIRSDLAASTESIAISNWRSGNFLKKESNRNVVNSRSYESALLFRCVGKGSVSCRVSSLNRLKSNPSKLRHSGVRPTNLVITDMSVPSSFFATLLVSDTSAVLPPPSGRATKLTKFWFCSVCFFLRSSAVCIASSRQAISASLSSYIE